MNAYIVVDSENMLCQNPNVTVEGFFYWHLERHENVINILDFSSWLKSTFAVLLFSFPYSLYLSLFDDMSYKIFNGEKKKDKND